MENKKDIGKAISNKLNSLDKTPKEQVWSGISYELQKKKRRIGFFFFWSRTIGLLLIGAIVGLYIYHQNGGFTSDSTNNLKEIINANRSNGKTMSNDSNDENSKNKSTKNNINGSNSIDDKNATGSKNNINDKNNIDGKNTTDKVNSANSKTENVLSNSSQKSNSNRISSKSGKNKTNLFSKANSKKAGENWGKKSKKGKANLSSAKSNASKSKTELIDFSSLQGKNSGDLTSEIKTKKTDSIVKKEKEKTITINMYPKDSIKKDSAKIYRKFYLDVFASPTMYGYFSKGSTLDSRLNSLAKKSEISFSYGIGLTYDLSEKITVRIGYNKINISYVTKNAPIDVSNYSGIDYYPNVSNQSIVNNDNFPVNGSAIVDLIQKISYTEIPLEVKYKFIDKKIGMKSSFGFSYLYLNENKVSIKASNGFSENIGKTGGLSNTSLSVNLGLEMDYQLFKNTKIFVEPMFNYQIKAFSNSDFKPYLLGIHTGIRYSFNNK